MNTIQFDYHVHSSFCDGKGEPEEYIKKAIEKYIAHEELKEIRNILIPYAEKAGYFTDEDIFKDIS